MLIESILKRKGGTVITLDGQKYEFTPKSPGAPHLCEVENSKHVKRLLDIPEGFREFTNQAVDAVETQVKAKDVAAVSEPSKQEDTEEKTKLVDLYIKKYGKKPHYSMTVEKLREVLQG